MAPLPNDTFLSLGEHGLQMVIKCHCKYFSHWVHVTPQQTRPTEYISSALGACSLLL
jgi:hypothetical protein